MTRSRYFTRWAGIVALALAALAPPALAQVTPGTACGAAGTGYVVGRDGRGVPEPRTAEQATAMNTYVAADGYWTICPKAEPPKPPADCPIPAPYRWTVGEMTCEAAGGGTVGHGKRSQAIQAQAGPVGGVVVLQCQNGALTQRMATCDKTTFCTASAYRGSDDGEKTFWTYAGRLRNGERGTAVLEGGTATRPIECNQGRLSLR